jgi:UDP-GlcNAc:undecaprenyl-phosphate GlcNAc-1-phosphate transferase
MPTFSDVSFTIVPALGAFVIALLVAPFAMQFCRRIDWVDKPNARKQHEGHVPLAGGLTLVVSLALAALYFQPPLAGATVLWPCCLMVFAVAFTDDRVPIRARYRFLVQLFAAFLFVAFSGIEVDHLGEIVGPFAISLGILGMPFAMVGISGLTNAINMMDGVDGLAGGVVLVALGWLLVIFLLIASDMPMVAVTVKAMAQNAILLVSLTIGALLAFLVFNQRGPWRKRADMFLGDGGSMTIGFAVASLLIFASTAFGEHSLTPVTAAWIVAVPLADIFTCMIRRVLIGVTPMTPDRKHVHHLLLELGFSTGSTVVLLQAVGIVTGLIGILGWRNGIPQYVMFWGICAVFAAYYVVSQRTWERIDARRPSIVPAPRASTLIVSNVRVEESSPVAETTGSQTSL